MTTRLSKTTRGPIARPATLRGAFTKQPNADPNVVRPATLQETLPIGLAALVAGMVALAICATHQYMLLYGDAVAHLGIARRIIDTNTPGLGQLGGVWLPLPHLLMLPFIGKMEWWQDGMAGAWPSLICYVASVMGIFRLARRMLVPRWAVVATAFFGLNANLLYLSTTAMTEPLFLALLIWIVLVTMELVAAVKNVPIQPTSQKRDVGHPVRAITNRLVLLGLLIFAATMTRYDGWVLGAAVWCVAVWHLWKAPQLRAHIVPGFVTFTLLTAAGPLLWFWYNHVFGHDWLDFMRGPYSAKEIDRKTSTPGAHKYWGWHNPAWSLMLYARTAQVDAAAWELGWLVAAAAIWGSWKAWAEGLDKTWLLLWLPLPFYVYSISYGSVPIFIPQLYPHSFYNSRYGMEMLPVLAIFLAYALYELIKRFGKASALVDQLTMPVVMLLIVTNTIAMAYFTPLVLKEAQVNSRGRLALEEPLTRELAAMGPGATILMENSNHVGALQAAGIPLKQTIGPSDYYLWRDALKAPAESAGFVVTFDGDEMSAAVKQHPEGLEELAILCSTKQPCVRIYQSSKWKK